MSYVKERLGNLSATSLILVMILFIFVSIVASISIGTVNIPFTEVWEIILNKIMSYLHIFGLQEDEALLKTAKANIVLILRTPRAFMAVIVGALLALAGVVMQATVQNPLADPYILGMSSGASFGATFAIACGATAFFTGFMAEAGIAIYAFLGAFVSAMAVLLLSSVGGRTTSVKLVLSGTIISSLFGAASNLVITLFADAEEMMNITFWILGSFAGATGEKLWLPLIALIIAVVFFTTQIRTLNIMLTGDETAATLGVDLNKRRRIYVFICAVLTACAVCFCGVIGFVGLMVPHIVRGLTGNNHWKLLPVSILVGSIFMSWADIATRVVLDHGELPIGIITAVCGAPIFAYIMIKKTYSFS